MKSWNQSDSVFDGDGTFSALEVFGICLQVIGIIENIIVVILLFSRPKLRKRAHEFFILCLSFSDLLVCSTSLIYYIRLYIKTDISSELFCRTIYIGWVLFYGTSLFLGFLISLERFNAVKFQSHSTFPGKSKYYVTIIPTTLLLILVVIIVNSVETTGYYHRCKVERMYSYNNLVFILVCTQLIVILPLVLLTIVLYGAAVCKLTSLLRKQQRVIKERNRLIDIGTCIPTYFTYLKLKLKANNLQSTPSKKTDRHFNIPLLCKTGRKSINNSKIHHNAQFGPDPAFKHNNRCTNRTKKLKTALITVLIILITLFITFIPHSVIQMLKLVHIHLPAVELSTRVILIAHPVVNPILYVWRIKTIRKELRCYI
ncbi:uncharacterized protein LOC117319819 [Pecten maximus]|uniref:uncharacterized protein LOC117319819 n=1 Tax=Pecten maximus TaxID=6579 RepID=UPI0014590211|nr:uncharacterized protein LOC117319819 [Pecten maximus]